ncbi:MAG TPA: LysM peptidoglycan-binding domain-containing protein [Actinomycetota bacterium]
MRIRLLITVLLAVMLLLLVPGLARARGNGSAHPPAASGTPYTVAPGDTLWSIANQIAPGRDPRPVIDRLQAANHLYGSLQAGQTLTIPASSR